VEDGRGGEEVGEVCGDFRLLWRRDEVIYLFGIMIADIIIIKKKLFYKKYF
jgi:hypothetical protein